MPELPEVETIARQLDLVLPGRLIRRLTVLDDKLAALRTQEASLPGGRIGRVVRSGKRVLLPVTHARSARSGWLAVHLRMTGRLLAIDDADDPPHLRLVLELDKGRLLLTDARRFATADWLTNPRDLEPPGLDPFDAACTAARLEELARGARAPIKTWLLDQTKISGLGNIYACEILHAAGLAPRRKAGSLDHEDWTLLRRHMLHILEQAIALCGTTFSDFQDSRGMEGGFGRWLQVYQRQGQTCRRCGAEITRETLAQRGTFWCPGCQH